MKKQSFIAKNPLLFFHQETETNETFVSSSTSTSTDAVVHRLAAFDFDWTLVKPKNNKQFPTNKDDWEWLYPSIPERIKELHEQGYTIGIFTNQSKEWKKEQIQSVIQTFFFPIYVGIAFDKKEYKPNSNLFEQFCLHFSLTLDKSFSFFVGDALGRPGDFADSDLQFAKNIGLTCYSPENFFLHFHLNPENQNHDHNTTTTTTTNDENTTTTLTNDENTTTTTTTTTITTTTTTTLTNDENTTTTTTTTTITTTTTTTSTNDENTTTPTTSTNDENNIQPLSITFVFDPPFVPKTDSPEILVLMGYPGSGKSSFASSLSSQYPLYQHIENDIIKTPAKRLKRAKEEIEKNHSIIFDGTHPSKEKRMEHVALAEKYHIPCRCIHFNTSFEQSNLQNKERSHDKRVPHIVYSVYKKKFELPNDQQEGFQQIHTLVSSSSLN